MKVLNSEEMRFIDNTTIKRYGIPSMVLMERAGLSVSSKIKEICKGKRVLFLCGGGNNGGDGLVAARDLYNSGYKTSVIILSKREALSPDCKNQYEIAKKIGLPITFSDRLDERDFHGVGVVVDAIFGTGLNRNIEGNIADVISKVNLFKIKEGFIVVSVDIPSGISADNGSIMGVAVKADYTITFGFSKVGHLLYPGAEHTGRLFIEDIGFPKEITNSKRFRLNLIDSEMVSGMIPQRQRYSYKGDYGHVFLVGGSKGKTGAILMAAKASLRAGSGLVTIGVPESLIEIFQERVMEEMTIPLDDDGRGMLSEKCLEKIFKFVTERADVIAIGPGMGVSKHTKTIMEEIILGSTVPVVIDADGINSITSKEFLRKAKSPIILTPHVGEMARLFRHKSEGEIRFEIERDRINIASSFSKSTATYLVLKGVPTIISEPEGLAFINTTGNPGMATAGSGDVLTGIIASLLGQCLTPLEASITGVFLHGLAGDMAACKKGYHSLIATDIIEHLPEAYTSFQDNNGRHYCSTHI